MLHHIAVWDSADLDKDKGEEWVHLTCDTAQACATGIPAWLSTSRTRTYRIRDSILLYQSYSLLPSFDIWAMASRLHKPVT